METVCTLHTARCVRLKTSMNQDPAGVLGMDNQQGGEWPKPRP